MQPIAKTAPKTIFTDAVTKDESFGGLRIVRTQSDQEAMTAFLQHAYEFQSPMAGYSALRATLSRKGFVGANGKPRIVVTVHPTLKGFVNMVMYDPSDPPRDNYQALGMIEMHERTQSDFKGQKATNKVDFREYLIEGIRGERPLFLPTISGWQPAAVFDRTVFVALDEEDPNAYYGYIYLPKSPVMQSDGQTQTAALFAVAHSKDAIDAGALENLIVTLEVELNVDAPSAAQSFADRNGRGSKKNKNLVINFDTSSALSQLRIRALTNTVFDGRIATGRNTSTTETATKYIVDLSTMEQMLLNIVAEGKVKAEQFKHFHVPAFEPFAREFIQLLDSLFSKQWPEETPEGMDAFRKIYVHGWPFALKAIALAYYRARIDQLAPITAAIGARDTGKTIVEAFKAACETNKNKAIPTPSVTFDELKDRLQKIDWHRYRKHWVDMTGAKIGKDGNPRKVKLVSVGNEEKVIGQAQNTPTMIAAVANKILSSSWTDLTGTTDA